jgi:hypothetical protein
MRANSILLTTSSAAAMVRVASAAVASSLASSARSTRMRASSAVLSWASKLSIVAFSRACSRRVAWAFSVADQNSGVPASASSSAMRDLLPAMSKMPPENLQAALQLGDALADRTDFHARQCSRRSPRGKGRTLPATEVSPRISQFLDRLARVDADVDLDLVVDGDGPREL